MIAKSFSSSSISITFNIMICFSFFIMTFSYFFFKKLFLQIYAKNKNKQTRLLQQTKKFNLREKLERDEQHLHSERETEKKV